MARKPQGTLTILEYHNGGISFKLVLSEYEAIAFHALQWFSFFHLTDRSKQAESLQIGSTSDLVSLTEAKLG